MEKDKNSAIIPCFAPRTGGTILAGIYTPTENEVVKLSTDTEITLDGIVMTYLEGTEICLIEGVAYNFNADTQIHKM